MSLFSWIRKVLGRGKPAARPEPLGVPSDTQERLIVVETKRSPEEAGHPARKEQGPQSAPQPAVPSAKPRFTGTKTPVTLTIGLDFGTSTVKCIIQAAVGERRRPERHVLAIHGEYLFPSLAWEWDGALTIGRRPHPQARCFRSVKVCLRCPILGEPCKKCFEGTGLTAEVVSWAMLSYCVNNIREQVEGIYPTNRFTVDWQSGVEWNMGVPLDGLEEQPLRDLFSDLLWRAVHFGHDVEQNMPCEAVLKRYGEISSQHCPHREQSNCFVLPEADVAVNAFLKSQRNIEDGLYFLCDVGAGTTDISFFRFAQNADRPIIFYGTSSTRVGADDFAMVIARHMAARKPGLSSAEALSAADRSIVGGLRCLNPRFRGWGGRYEVFDDIYKKMEEGRKRALGRAFAKERELEHWKGLRGALIGGGKGLPGVASIFERPVSHGNPLETIRPEIIPLKIAVVPGATDLHGIAFGLSIPMAEYYEHWPPGEVPEMERDEMPFHDTNRYVDFHDDW